LYFQENFFMKKKFTRIKNDFGQLAKFSQEKIGHSTTSCFHVQCLWVSNFQGGGPQCEDMTSTPRLCVFWSSVQIAVNIYRTNLNWLSYDRSVISVDHCGYTQSETTKRPRFCDMISGEGCMALNNSRVQEWCLTTDWSSRTRNLSLEVDHDLYLLKQAWLCRLTLQIPWAHNLHPCLLSRDSLIRILHFRKLNSPNLQ